MEAIIAGTLAGGAKMRATMIARYGSEKAWRDHMRSNASKGGRNGNTGGFAANPELARTAGRKGGLKSRRGPVKITKEVI